MEELWTDPSGVVALQPGGLAKVKERNAPPLPANLVQAMQFAIESLPTITGINLEFLGLANRAQAGVLEQQRKQSVISGLAEYFAALRLYRQNSGRYMMTLIMKYLADGRMIRISGPNGPPNVPLPVLLRRGNGCCRYPGCACDFDDCAVASEFNHGVWRG